MCKKFISFEQILNNLKETIEKREYFYLNYDKNEELGLKIKFQNLLKKRGGKNDLVRKFSCFCEVFIGETDFNGKKPIMTRYNSAISDLCSDTGVILLEVFLKMLHPTEIENVEKFNCALNDFKSVSNYKETLKKLSSHILLIG
jgi:hypothetical protein